MELPVLSKTNITSWMIAGLTASILSLSSLTTNAALVVVDPDAFAAGTNITNAYAGVTLQVISRIGGVENQFSDVYATAAEECTGTEISNYTGCTHPYLAPTGANVFGDLWYDVGRASFCFSDPENCMPGSFSALLITLDSPTDFVSIQGAWKSGDSTKIQVLDANRNGLGIKYALNDPSDDIYSMPFYDNNGNELREIMSYIEYLPIQRDTADIKYIIAAGWSGHSDLDNFQFNQVPIPTTGWLFGSALAALLVVRRKQS